MFEDDPWLDAGIEAEDDPPAIRPRHPWFDYVGIEPHRPPTSPPDAPYRRAAPSRKPEDPA